MELGASVPAFLGKLWKLVEDPETDDLICWAPNGRSFFIRNQAQFARELLPHYYKHNNMASFVRQLNMYGFHKIVSVELGGLKCDKDEMEFAHQYFVQGHPYLLDNIKRKIASNRDPTHALYKPELMNKMLTEVRSMRGRQEHLDTRLGAMKRENEALWRELAVLRQKHMKQQQIVNKLIHFLVTLVQPSRGGGLSVKRRYPLMIDDTKRHKQQKIPKMQSSAKGPVIHELNGSEHELETQYMEMLEDPMIQSPEQPSPVSDEVEGVNYEEEILPSELEIPLQQQNNGVKKHTKGKKKANESLLVPSPEPAAVVDEIIEGITHEEHQLQTQEPKKKVKGKKKRKNNVPIKILIPSTDGDEDEREDNVVFKVETDLGAATVEAVKSRAPKPVPVATVRSSKLAAMAANLNKASEPAAEAEIEFDLDENLTKDDPKDFYNLVKLEDILVVPESSADGATTSFNAEASTSSAPTDLTLSCINTPGINQPVGRLESIEEMDGHLDTVQNELENLREVLRNEGCSIDATTLLGLFGPDDPMSFGIPLEPELDPSYSEDNYSSVGDSQNKLGGGKLIAYNSANANAALNDMDSEMLMTPPMPSLTASDSELNSDYCLEVDNLDKDDSKSSFFNSLLSLDEESKKN